MPLEFIDMNSPPVVAVNCDNPNVMGKEKWHRMRFEKSTKNDNIELRKKRKYVVKKTDNVPFRLLPPVNGLMVIHALVHMM